MERLENTFYTIGGIGSIVIMFITIFLIDNPFELFKGINFDYPMFLLYSVPFILGFFVILYIIFKIITKKKELES